MLSEATIAAIPLCTVIKAFFFFQANFTQAMVDRLTIMGSAIIGNNVTVSEATIAASTVHIHLDMTNQQVGYSLQLTLAAAYRAFTESLLASCNIGDLMHASVSILFKNY
jgi:hypothetical protein